MSTKKTLAILVGGGPAPGINAVLAAATIEARNHGLRVLGCYDGFKWLVQGDTQHVVDLEINDTSRIHFDGGSIIRTSRTNPSKSAEAIRQVACNLGKELVRNLMQDAQTTERWFFVTVMGRHAGHLALGIGGSAAATLTVIAEEFPEPHISLERVADTLEGAIIKRRVQGREHGVAILSEGLGEKLDLATLGDVERDAYGNVRLTELDIGHVLKDRVTASLKSRGVDVTITAKDLGYWAVRFLLEGGSNAMVTIQAGRLVPIPFGLMVDPKTGKVRVRYVDVESEMYQTLSAYMIRLKPEDLANPDSLAALAKAGNLSETELIARFGPLVGRG